MQNTALQNDFNTVTAMMNNIELQIQWYNRRYKDIGDASIDDQLNYQDLLVNWNFMKLKRDSIKNRIFQSSKKAI